MQLIITWYIKRKKKIHRTHFNDRGMNVLFTHKSIPNTIRVFAIVFRFTFQFDFDNKEEIIILIEFQNSIIKETKFRKKHYAKYHVIFISAL